MSDLLPAAKAIEELEPAVQAFAEATGALGPVRELAAWATDLIRYRRAPYQAKLLMRAAEKIKASGLPPSAVEDRLLRAVLEDGAMEDDEGMQERWANLLANAGTSSTSVRAVFPTILSELDPAEARLLDRLAARADAKTFHLTKLDEPLPGWVPPGGRDNLMRLRVLREIRNIPTIWGASSDESATVVGFALTTLGWEFVQICQAPRATG